MKPLHIVALALLSATLPSFAQQVISAKSGLLSYVEGAVTLNGEPVDFSGVHFSDVKENAVVRTADGRAEVLLTPGVVLRMGENSSLRMIANRLVDTRLELLTGSAVVEADQIAKDTSVTIVCKDAVVTLPKAGLFRFDTEPAQLKVFKGDADVEVAGNAQAVSGGHEIGLSNGAATVAKFDAEDTDSLDRWSHRRGSYLAMANASAANSLTSSSGGYGIGGYGYGGYGLGGYGLGAYAMSGWGLQGCSSAWAFNMYYNMMTYMPCYGSLWSPYGYRFYSPSTIYRYNGFAPPLYGGGAGRTGTSASGSASLARPVATASNRSNSPAPALGTSRGAFSNSGGAGRVGGATSAIASSGGSGGGGGFGGSSGGAGGGAGAAGGGGHAGGGGGRR